MLFKTFKHVMIFLTQQPFVLRFVFSNKSRDFAYPYDFVVQHEYIFSCVRFGKVQNRKNIIEVPCLVLFLYNKMSIKNSFVQCPIVFVCDL